MYLFLYLFLDLFVFSTLQVSVLPFLVLFTLFFLVCFFTGVSIAYYMTSNRIEDAVLRLSAAVSGHIVVTINWNSDSCVSVQIQINLFALVNLKTGSEVSLHALI